MVTGSRMQILQSVNIQIGNWNSEPGMIVIQIRLSGLVRSGSHGLFVIVYCGFPVFCSVVYFGVSGETNHSCPGGYIFLLKRMLET